MLDVFSLIFVADTKIIFRYDFVAPLRAFSIEKTLLSVRDFIADQIIMKNRMKKKYL